MPLIVIQGGIATFSNVDKIFRVPVATGRKFTGLGRAVVDALPSFIPEHLDWRLTAFCTLTEVSIVDTAQQGSLSLHFALGEVQFTKGSSKAISAVSDTGVFPSQPRVLETLINCDALFNVHGEHPVDQIQGWIAHGVPIRRWIVKLAHLDLLGEGVGIVSRSQFIRERWEAAKTNVKYNTQGPHVYCLGVLPGARVLQNFWGHIWWD